MRLLVALLAVAAMVAIGLARRGEPEPVAGHLRMAIDTAASSADFSRTAGRQGFVVLQEWEHERMRALKARDPELRVLVYKDLAAMMARDEAGNASTGVTVEDAATHPEWFLLDPAGERLTFDAYPWLSAADLGNADYQRLWADRVLAVLRAQPWDGVFVDDANPTLRHHTDPTRVARYPDDAAYGAATGAALAAIGPRIKDAGKLVIANFGSWADYRQVCDPWLEHVSGAMEEQFAKFGTTPGDGYVTGEQWERQVGAIEAAESRGRLWLGITHSTRDDAAAARYGWASVLLAAGGRSAFALHETYADETWFPEYDAELGKPDGKRTRDPSGLHRRKFEGGLVLVNPTDRPIETGFGAVMAPHTGAILTGD